jgi:AraC-like DNA-binding protein
MLMEPGELHVTNRLVGLSSYVVLFLPQDIVKNLLREEIKSAPHFKTACLRNKDMTKAFLQLHASLTTQSTTLEKQSLLTQCFSRLFQEAGENMAALSCENRKIDLTHVQDYLQAHWNKDVGLDELARLAGTNRYRLLRSFSHQFGLPPHAYQLQVRIERARLLLKKGAGFSSLDLGFSDQSHFIRHFKRLLGLTPGQYASQIK